MVPAITDIGVVFQRADGVKFRIVPSIAGFYDYIDEHSNDGTLPDDVEDCWVVMPEIYQGVMSYVDYHGNGYHRTTLETLPYAEQGFIDD
jgi:hypothetical protein